MSKSKSPEAAQRKVWAQEIRQLEASAKKLNSDFDAEQRTLQKAIRAAEKQLSLANRKYAAFVTRRAKIRQLEASAKKLNSDFYAEQRTLQKAIRAAERQLSLANRKYAAFVTRRAKVVPKTLREIETRIAVLRGRIEA